VPTTTRTTALDALSVTSRSRSAANQVSMRYDDLFARLDDEDLVELLGRGAVRLIRALDPETTSVSALGELAASMYPPTVMLRDESKRRFLLESLPESNATDLVQALGRDPEGSPWETLLRLKYRPGGAEEVALFAFFGLTAPPLDIAEGKPAQTPASVEYGLFDHQRLAANRVLAALGERPHKTLLHMPTGAGKTRTSMHVIADLLRAHEPSLAIWLAFSEELCEQAASEFSDAWTHLGNRETNLYRFWGSRKTDITEAVDGFVVLGLAKGFATAKRDTQFLARLADRASLIVFDEAHQAVAPAFKFVLEALADRHPDTPLLGLSATPGRTWNDPEKDAELAALFNRSKVTLEVEGFDNPVDYLIDEGYLARPIFEAIEHQGRELSEAEVRGLTDSLDIQPALLEQLASDEQRNLIIVDRVEQISTQHDRILVFAATVEHAYLLSTVLNARGIESAAVTGTTERTQRASLIDRFKSDRPGCQVLCNYGVLTTGFDAPRTSAAVIARPTKSLVLYSQMVGRAIRGPRAGGNEDALIVTIVDTNLPGFGQPRDAFINWEDVWS